MADFYIELSELADTNSQLADIIQEFEDASSNASDLEAAIAQPYFRSELAISAGDFESRWSYKRKELREGLEEIQEHLDAIVKSVEHFDSEVAGKYAEAASNFTIELTPQQ